MQRSDVERALAEPFDPGEVKWKPGIVSGSRALALAFVDARVVQDRLDQVLGVSGWQDTYTVLADGSVLCRLRIRIGDEWITKMDVGGQSEQPDEGDRMKAAVSDALKRAAVKVGVGRYLYRLPGQWVDYDPQKRQFKREPKLPDWAIPKPQEARQGTPAPAANQEAKEDSGEPLGEEGARKLAEHCRMHGWPCAGRNGWMAWVGMAVHDRPEALTKGQARRIWLQASKMEVVPDTEAPLPYEDSPPPTGEALATWAHQLEKRLAAQGLCAPGDARRHLEWQAKEEKARGPVPAYPKFTPEQCSWAWHQLRQWADGLRDRAEAPLDR